MKIRGLVVLIALLFSASGLAEENLGAYGVWRYSKEIFVQEQSLTNLTDYSVKVILNESTFDYAKANVDGSDIRFSTAEGNSLSYFIDAWNKKGESVLWVKIPALEANETKTIRMYYGNPKAETESSGDAVFELYDGFDGTDINFEKWTFDDKGGVYPAGNSSTYVVSNGTFRVHAENIAGTDSRVSGLGLMAQKNVNFSAMLEFKARIINQTGYTYIQTEVS